MAIDIVDFPIKNGDFPLLYEFTRGYPTQKSRKTSTGMPRGLMTQSHMELGFGGHRTWGNAFPRKPNRAKKGRNKVRCGSIVQNVGVLHVYISMYIYIYYVIHIILYNIYIYRFIYYMLLYIYYYYYYYYYFIYRMIIYKIYIILSIILYIYNIKNVYYIILYHIILYYIKLYYIYIILHMCTQTQTYNDNNQWFYHGQSGLL